MLNDMTMLSKVELFEAPQVKEVDNTTLAAMELYDMGFNIFPLEYGSKKSTNQWDALYNARIPGIVIPNIFKKKNIATLTGRLSKNLFVVDCDDETKFNNMRDYLEAKGLASWVVSTSRGGHFWFLSIDGEVVSQKVEDHIEVWGNSHYVITPPSVNKETGLVYTWLRRDGSLPPSLLLDEIKGLFPSLKVCKPAQGSLFQNGLPLLAHEVLVNKNKMQYHSYSEAENAAVWSLIRFGWADEAIVKLFNTHNPPHYATKGNPEEWLLKYMISKARSLISPLHESAEKINRAVNWAHSQPWNTRTGSTDKQVFLACCKRAMIEGADNFRATNREIADLTNIRRETVLKSLPRLIKKGYLILVSNEDKRAGYRYKISDEICNHTISSTLRDNGVILSSSLSLESHDTWHPRALGKTALSVYQYLHANPNKSIEEICTQLQRGKPTIAKAIEKLAKYKLAKSENDNWNAIARNEQYLNIIALSNGVLGIHKKRKEEYREDREKQAYSNFIGKFK